MLLLHAILPVQSNIAKHTRDHLGISTMHWCTTWYHVTLHQPDHVHAKSDAFQVFRLYTAIVTVIVAGHAALPEFALDAPASLSDVARASVSSQGYIL